MLLEESDNSGSHDIRRKLSFVQTRPQAVRALALLCACSLSVGSHYGSYILGPLKSRLAEELGTSNTEFSLLVAAISLNSTWTPLVGGLLASRLGTTATSIMATSLIFLGQAVLLLGDILQSIRLMIIGMVIFGLGVSPLAVVQESIIVRFFKNHGLASSMALGLVVGKASSFAAARTSYPLSKYFGSHAPFYVATILAAFSFAVNLIYMTASKWLVKSSGTEVEVSELQVGDLSDSRALEEVVERRRVYFRDIFRFGDVFWAYIGINVLCGSIWHPFIHLAPNIIEQRYGLSASDSSDRASYLLAGSVFLYPVCGFAIDRLKKGPILSVLLILSSLLTLLCYLWLALPANITTTPNPAIALYGVSLGFSPLILVVIVPTIVSNKFIPTTLGAHKSLEQAGATLLQTAAGLWLDHGGSSYLTSMMAVNHGAVQQLLYSFLTLNLCQMMGIIGLIILNHRAVRARRRTGDSFSGRHDEHDAEPIQQSDNRDSHDDGYTHSRLEEEPLLANARSPDSVHTANFGLARTESERKRGHFFAMVSFSFLCLTWTFFLGTAYLKLVMNFDVER